MSQFQRRHHRPRGVRIHPAVVALLALLVLFASLLSHGPAWLVAAALATASNDVLGIESAEGLWHAGQGRLRLAGAAESLPLTWRLTTHGLGVAVELGDGLRGNGLHGAASCDLRSGCASAGVAGHLPGGWLPRLAPALNSIGLEGQLDWQLRNLQWSPDGSGSMTLEWHSDALYAAALGLPLGWYAGTLQGQWSGAERQPRLALRAQSSPPAHVVPPVDVRAEGQVGVQSLAIAGQLSLATGADPRYAQLLQMLGLASTGGAFTYRSGG